MTEVIHPDERVALAFEARQEALKGAEWEDIATAGYIPNEREWMRLNLSVIEYPAWHPLHPCQAYKVTCNGEGNFTGQNKSAAMRRLVREELGIKQAEFKWLMTHIGGRDPQFRHTWWIFTEDELRSAERLHS